MFLLQVEVSEKCGQRVKVPEAAAGTAGVPELSRRWALLERKQVTGSWNLLCQGRRTSWLCVSEPSKICY